MAEWDASFSCCCEIEKYQRTEVDRGNESIVSSLLIFLRCMSFLLPFLEDKHVIEGRCWNFLFLFSQVSVNSAFRRFIFF